MSKLWLARRSALNHDWLKNDFTKSVGAFVARLEQRKPDESRVRDFLIFDLPAWQQHGPELRQLLRDAEEALSPQSFFCYYPLSLCTSETLLWLPSTVHALWLTKYGVRSRVAEALQAMELADKYYAVIDEVRAKMDLLSIAELKSASKTFRGFSDALRELSHAISALPHRILVV
ncbi:MAG: hypothetical protein HN742_11090 [Lentisphaerae bacterium]|jgi:hypothetical protein|nr:hypothetical protein [Lentisphaerota bacterium]MBT4815791.1 hypothetical protein [Lentisphaerota bacterium]MBT5610498.1 hypothetical protein [Lentisphaerota bacterium]MBT7056053.1 hypothetical protein [Lentisphaerota bacterium]MBT7842410.1 hypothetical protein [Lentisphaerota bacterium]